MNLSINDQLSEERPCIRETVEYLQKSIKAEFVFALDAQVFPTPSCLLEMARSINRWESRKALVATPEIITSPDLLKWKRCLLLNRGLFLELLSNLSPASEHGLLGQLNERCLAGDVALEGVPTAYFYYVGAITQN
jgi:hypothetical protein